MNQADLIIARKIDHICNEFEENLSSGEHPALRDALSQVDSAEQKMLFRELLAIEVEWRLSRSLPTVDDYLIDFPNERKLIEEVFEEVFAGASDRSPAIEYTNPNSPDIDFKNEIGRGGMGVIVRGHDKGLERDVAFKILHSELAGSREAHERFEQEARVCGRLEHPGIVPVHSLGRLQDGRPFFSMKLVEGTTLKDLLLNQRDSISDQRLLDIFVQTCHAVGYAHACDVIHRDLKPENVMVGVFGEVQVMDWGLSKDVSISGGEKRLERSEIPVPSGYTRMGSVLGTPSYMSPEQAMGELDVVDARSDVFSLGVILCEILAGTSPIDLANSKNSQFLNEESIAESFRLIESKNCHAELVSILRSCLDSNPEKRPQNAADLAHAIEDYREGVQKRLREAELTVAQEKARVAEYAKRRRVLFVSVVCLVCLIATIFSIVHSRNQDRRRRLAMASLALNDAKNLFEQAADTRTFESPLWRHARRDAERASSLLIDQEPGAPLYDETFSLIRRLDFILKLGAIRKSESETNVELNCFSNISAIPRYRQAFVEFGLRPNEDTAMESANRLGEFPDGAKLLLLIALSRCSEARSPLKNRQWWFEVVVRLDKDKWRKQVRDAIEMKDHQKLIQSVLNVDYSQQPPFFLVQLAKQLYYEKHLEDAEQILRRAQMAHPNDFWVNQDLAVLLESKRPPQLDDAIRYYTTAVALQKRAGALLNLGATLIQANRYKEAEVTLQEAITLRPKYSYAYCFLAQAQIKDGNFEAAKKNLEIAGTLRKNIHHWHYTYGMYHFEREEFAKALPFLKEACKLRPHIINQVARYSRTLFQRKKIAEALSYIELANELKPSNPHTLYHYAHMNASIGNLADAERLYREIITIDPMYAEAHCNLGHIYRQRGEYELALISLKKGHQIGLRKRGWRYPSDRWIAELEKLIQEQSPMAKNESKTEGQQPN